MVFYHSCSHGLEKSDRSSAESELFGVGTQEHQVAYGVCRQRPSGVGSKTWGENELTSAPSLSFIGPELHMPHLS